MLQQLGTIAAESLKRARLVCANPDWGRGDSAWRTAKEASEALARRSILASAAYPVAFLMVELANPAGTRDWRIAASVGLVLLLLSAMRIRLALHWERLCAAGSHRWRRDFHIVVYASAAVWASFSIAVMNAAGSGWPSWMMMVLAAGISSVAVTALCSDPRLLRGCLAVLLLPIAVWGLLRGDREGTAMAA